MPKKAEPYLELRKDQKILAKKLVFRIFFALGVFFILYLWVFGIFSNINNFWFSLFGRKSNVLKVDTVSPLPPYIYRIPNYTNKDSVGISGTAEPSSKIQLFLNKEKVEETIADKDGQFNFGEVNLKEKTNTFYGITLDQNGNSSVESRDRIIMVDKDKPKIELEKPEAGKSYLSKVRSMEVVGKTEPLSTITINGSYKVPIDKEGNFSYSIYPTNGSNKLQMEVIDKAGNTSKKEVFYSFNEE